MSENAITSVSSFVSFGSSLMVLLGCCFTSDASLVVAATAVVSLGVDVSVEVV